MTHHTGIRGRAAHRAGRQPRTARSAGKLVPKELFSRLATLLAAPVRKALSRRRGTGRQRGTVDRVLHARMMVWRAVYQGAWYCLVALAACAFGLAVGRWTGWWPSPYPAVLDIFGPPVLLAYVGWGQQRLDRSMWDPARGQRLEMSLDDLDALGHEEFEFAVRDLLRRDGFTAERVGGSDDDACDVRAVDPDRRIWAVQCKHRREGRRGDAVDVRVVRELKGTAGDVHKATFAAIVTNGRFTGKAIPHARNLGVHPIDRDVLGQWAAGRPLWELLERVPMPLRHPPGERPRPR